MKKITFFLIFLPSLIISQTTAILKGTVKNTRQEPIENVSITYKNTGTITDKSGNYQIKIPLKEKIIVLFSHISYHAHKKTIITKNIDTIRYFPTLILKTEELAEIIVKDTKKKVEGITKIDIKKAQTLVGSNPGVENVLMTLPGVNNNNELSTQYNVRGGNFDENLVYVNGIEIYRPFLIRAGQQEGLSFINTNMVQNINFSAGGFQAKYGDRLSSVLDITYKKATRFSAIIDASLLGGSATFEGQFLNKKLSAITGIRYRDNSLFVNSKQIKTNFSPKFTDVQSFLSYSFSKRFSINLLGNFSLNNYHYSPVSRRTRFGTIADPIELIVFYKGQEKDSYLTMFGALSTEYIINENLTLTGTISSYNTQEEEYFDIAASYNLGEVNTDADSENFGKVEFSQGIGSQLNHARNDLDALISNIQIRGTHKKGKQQLDFGIKYQKENTKDRIREWEVIDSLGFSIRPPHHTNNNQPYQAFEGPIIPFQNIRAENEIQINRLSGFVQYSNRLFWNKNNIWYNLGVRAQNWLVKSNGLLSKNQLIISPRAQLVIKPNWQKDMLFKISGGWYSQPPFYKELKDNTGTIRPEIKAQKSIHLVLGMDYSFELWKRPFKLTTEIYHKDLFNVNSYTIDNVRIRYRADNLSTAYAYGLDIRLNGEFVPGNESWISLGYLKTEENINNRGHIARPTDQRIKFGILFQDYVPAIPNLKAYLNLVYNSGVPGGSPSYADAYLFQGRLRDYKRADLGISYIFSEAKKSSSKNWLSSFKELSLGLELFNIFDIQNSITNIWVRDAYSKNQFGIPNFMTGRVLNFKVRIRY